MSIRLTLPRVDMTLAAAGHPSPVFVHPLRIYYAQTDAGGVVYHANYLTFMETARTEYLRACGIELGALAEQAGVLFVVHRADVRFRRPARLDDLIDVSAVGRARVEFSQQIRRGDELLVEASIELACVHRIDWRPVALPARVRIALEKKPQ
jgi:acyl-CoA thioester hydrolase